MMRKVLRAAMWFGATLAAGLTAPAIAPGAVEKGPNEIVVTDDQGGSAVIERAPFRITFYDAQGNPVLGEVENAIPSLDVTIDPEPGGFDNLQEGGGYSPLSFEVGGEKNLQHPGGLWTGNMLIGARAGIVHAAVAVTDAKCDAGGAVLKVQTTDPTRNLRVEVRPDRGSGIRVSARPDHPLGVSSMSESFGSAPAEAFHGFGGRHNAINQRGNDFYNWIEEEAFGGGPLEPVTEEVPGSGGDRYLFPGGPTQAYYVQNIMYSSLGYGFLLNETELSRWRMASDRDDAWQVNVSGTTLDYTVALGGVRESLDTITAISGRHPVSPAWAMGPMVKRNVQQGNSDPEKQQALILEDLENIERYDVPLQGYAYESWDTLPEDFVREVNHRLHAMGIRPVGYVRAYVNDDGNFDPPGTFQDAVSRGLVAKTPAGAPFVGVAVGPAALLDFTNPETVDWWWKRKIKPMLDMGFHGFMQDFGEQAQSDMQFHNGETGETMHNRYPIVFHKTTRELTDAWEAKRAGRPKIWMYTRAGFSGRKGSAPHESANFPGDETADWQRSIGLPSLATDMLSRSVGGSYGFTTDIGGYFDSYANDVLDDELYTRWSQWSSLTPFYRVHNSCCTNGTIMPWDLSEKTLRLWKRYARLHVRARPYMRKLWRRAQRTGVPITRPMWMSAPGDPVAEAQEQQWMLGSKVLVAPVVEKGATSREVYFPTGCWRRPGTGERYRGTQVAEVDAPLRELPYFVRCGTRPFAR